MKRPLFLTNKLLLIIALTTLCSSCARPRILKPPNLANRVYNPSSNQAWHPLELKGKLQISKTEKIAGVPVGSILEYGDYLLFCTANGYLYSGFKADISELVNIRLGKGCSATPTLYKNIVYLSFLKGEYGLIAYDLRTAKEIWNVPEHLSSASPIIVRGLLVHSTNDGKITAFTLKDHSETWSVDTGSRIVANPVASDSQIFITGRDGLIQSYALENGTLQWSTRTNDHFYAPSMLIGQSLYAFSYSGTIYQFDIKTGQELNRYKTSAPIYQAAANDKNNLYICSADGEISALTQSNLTKLWSRTLNGPASAAPVSLRNELLIPLASRTLYRINSANGKTIQKLNFERRITNQPLVCAEQVFVGTRTASFIELKEAGKKP